VEHDVVVRLAWGRRGAREAAARGDLLVVVDVLSFSTAVSIALGRGARVHPAALGEDLRARADLLGAELAVPRDEVPAHGRYSLSPPTMRGARAGERILVASPNGATCAQLGSSVPALLVGCLRNASATARAVEGLRAVDSGPRVVTVLACGERHADDDTLRFALEDWLGAGAIVSGLAGARAPEAAAACASFLEARADLGARLRDCPSGIELIDRGYGGDVDAAAGLDEDGTAAVWCDGWLAARG